MKFPQSISLRLPLFLFVSLLLLVLAEVFYVEESTPAANLDRVFYLIIHISFWLSAAHLLNALLSKYLWGGIAKVPVGNFAMNKLKEFLSVASYMLVLVLIFVKYFSYPLTFNLVAAAIILAILGMFVRPYFMCFLRSVFLSNSVAFNIGDWVRLSAINSDSEVIGVVDHIDRKNLKLKTENNNIITISQSSLNDFVIENYWGSGKEARFEVNVSIDFSVSTNRVKRILKAASKQAIEEFNFLAVPEPEILIKRITASGIEYAIYFWIIPWEEISPADAKDKIIAKIMEHLAKSGLSLSYPKEDIYISQMPDRQTQLSEISDVKKVISHVELFDSLNEAELDKIVSGLIKKEFTSGTILIKEGNDGDSMFIVIEGLMDVFVNSADGQHIKVGRLTPGDYFGEMSLMTGDKRSATVTAATDVLVFEITKDLISKIIEGREEVINEFGEIISRRNEVNIKFKESFEKSKQNFLNDVVKKIKKFFRKD